MQRANHHVADVTGIGALQHHSAYKVLPTVFSNLYSIEFDTTCDALVEGG